MGYTYTIDTDNLDEVKTALSALVATPADTEAVRKDIGEEMIVRTHDRFMSGQGVDGEAWAESARVKKDGGQTLLDHGTLRDSVHYEPTPEGDLELYSNDIRAAVHNEGKTILPKNGEFLIFKGEDGKMVFTREVHMPKREFLGFSDADLEMVSQKFLDDIDRRFSGAK